MARQTVTSSFYSFFLLHIDLSSCFFFLFDCFLSFLYFIECVCRACRTYYDGMALHCPLPAYVATWYIFEVAL